MELTLFRQTEHERLEKVLCSLQDEVGKDTYLDLLSILFDIYKSSWPQPEDPINGKARWDVTNSSFKQLVSNWVDSKVYKSILPMFKLGELGETIRAYGELVQNWVKWERKVRPQIKIYDEELIKASQLLKSPGIIPCRLYASVKTWEKDDEFLDFMGSWPNYVNSKVEFIIEGPLRMLLQLSPEALLLIFKLPTVIEGKESDRLRDITLVSQDIYNSLHNSEFFNQFIETTRLIIDNYNLNFASEFPDNRSMLPTVEARKKFVNFVNRGG